MSATQSFASDKENETPGARENGTKRRRTDAYSTAEENTEDDDEDNEPPTQPELEDEDEGEQKFYNPNQDPEKRRRLRATMRDHQRMVEGSLPRLYYHYLY
jgi:hypothetical protein